MAKLIYNVFNTSTNQTETKSVLVNKQNKDLVKKGIKTERNEIMRMTRRLFTYTFLDLNRTYLNNEFKVNVRVEMNTRRPGVTRGFKQKIDLLLTNSKGLTYAINFANTSFDQIDPIDVAARSNHIYKTFRGRAYTFTFTDFTDVALKATKYAHEILDVLNELKEIKFFSAKVTIPTMQQVRHCIDNAADRVIMEDEIVEVVR